MFSKKNLECACDNQFHLNYTNIRKNSRCIGPTVYWHSVFKMKLLSLKLLCVTLISTSLKVVCSETKFERCNQFFKENLSQLEQEDPKLIKGIRTQFQIINILTSVKVT